MKDHSLHFNLTLAACIHNTISFLILNENIKFLLLHQNVYMVSKLCMSAHTKVNANKPKEYRVT